tara:strand:- start:166 stop:489 length:324 start_codon:yes stop_codon:yes gene_type:complete
VVVAVALDTEHLKQIQEQMVAQDQLEILVDHSLVVVILVLVQFQDLTMETKVPKDGQIQVVVLVVLKHLAQDLQLILELQVLEVVLALFLSHIQHKYLKNRNVFYKG